MALRKCSPTQRGPKAHERNVKDAKHKPKLVAARFVKGWKKQLGRGTQVCAIKAEATLPSGWDYGFYGLFEITLADGAELRAAVSIHYDGGVAVSAFSDPTVEASGTVTLDAAYGGVVATYRGRTWDQVEAELIDQTGRHLAPTAKRAGKKKATTKKAPRQGFPPLDMFTGYHFGSAQHQRAAIRRDNNGYTAVTPTQSKIFKTQGGAEGWLAERIGAENMTEAKLDVPDGMPMRTVKRGGAAKPKAAQRKKLIAAIWSSKHPDYRSKRGDQTHPSILMMGKGGGAELWPLDTFSDADLQDLAAKLKVTIPPKRSPLKPKPAPAPYRREGVGAGAAQPTAADVAAGPSRPRTAAEVKAGVWTLSEREKSTLVRTVEEIGGGDFVPTGAAQKADVRRLETLGLVYRERPDRDGPYYFTATRAGEALTEKLRRDHEKQKGAGMATKKKATKKATKPAPRADQTAALRKYRAAAGADWKAKLSRDWMHAGSRVVDADTYALLHQLRNSHGPSWLVAFTLNGKATKKKAPKKAPKKKAPKKKAPKKKAAAASLFEVYYTVEIPYSDTPTKWHPTEKTGPLSTLTRGAHEKKNDAVAWAKTNLRGQPYNITAHDDVTRPKTAWYRQADEHALDRVIELGGDRMKKAARAEKRRRKDAAGPRQGSLAFNGNGNGKKGLSAREKAAAAWLRSGGKR